MLTAADAVNTARVSAGQLACFRYFRGSNSGVSAGQRPLLRQVRFPAAPPEGSL